MAAVRQLKAQYPKYSGTGDEIQITEQYYVDGNVFTAKDDGALPAYNAAHGDVATAKVYRREVFPADEAHSWALIHYSDNPERAPAVDGGGELIVDMMGRTERQMWDITDHTVTIGANNEGAEVYRPHGEVIYTQLESSLDDADIFAITGHVNNAPYQGFATRTLLFLGARARKTGDSRWRVTYHFLYDLGEHVARWRRYFESSSGDFMVPAYGAEETAVVYTEADFSALPI